MEIVSFAKDVLQNVAERAVSYKFGQTVLRHFDRALWVLEKCARWAVPPPLDQDERPQPELVRPLPWVFFLSLLVALRITRESISLVNLALGKPPLRSADVVTYIQSKRRYLRTLKYQGNRIMRARSTSPTGEPWFKSLQSLFEFTMCFRRQTQNGNNNSTSMSNNDEVLVVKKSKRGRQNTNLATSNSEPVMERLIEKMMVDLDANSDDDSSFTLTNVTSVKSDRTEDTSDSDDNVQNNEPSSIPITNSVETQNNIQMEDTKECPTDNENNKSDKKIDNETKIEINDEGPEPGVTEKANENVVTNHTQEVEDQQHNASGTENHVEAGFVYENDLGNLTPKELSQQFILNEAGPHKRQKLPTKMVNGALKTSPNKKKGVNERRNTNSPLRKLGTPDGSLDANKENKK